MKSGRAVQLKMKCFTCTMNRLSTFCLSSIARHKLYGLFSCSEINKCIVPERVWLKRFTNRKVMLQSVHPHILWTLTLVWEELCVSEQKIHGWKLREVKLVTSLSPLIHTHTHTQPQTSCKAELRSRDLFQAPLQLPPFIWKDTTLLSYTAITSAL